MMITRIVRAGSSARSMRSVDVGGDDVAGAGEDAHGRLLMMVAAAVQAWALCSAPAPGWTETGAMAAPMKKVDSASAATAEAMWR
jgi:hypothetical protein